MPRGDGTGPVGRGAMTGRAAGYCAGFNVPGYLNSVSGRGRAWRRGVGRRAAYVQVQAPDSSPYQKQPFSGTPAYENNSETELEYLKNTEKAIKEELEAIRKRMEEIKNSRE